jgi:hypothetical protein
MVLDDQPISRSAPMQADTTQNLAPRFMAPSVRSSVALLALVVVFFGVIRWRLREMPLERDEGEYAYAGQLLLQRIAPYKLAYNMKLPGIYAAYAGTLAVFGESPAGIHIGLMLVNAAATVALYFLAAFVFGRLAGIVASASYALLSTSSSMMGFEAHATHFVVLPAIVGILLLLRGLGSGSLPLLFLSGAFSGVAFLMKQHGMFFVLFCLYLICTERIHQPGSVRILLRGLAAFVSGAILPYAITCWLLYRAGVFRQFWFWTVSYAGEYSKMGLRRALRAFLENFSQVASPAVPIWILAAVGLSALLWSPLARTQGRFILGLFAFSFLALCPGAYFRPHYFILLLPVIAIFVGVAVGSLTEKLTEPRKPWYLTIIPAAAFLACFAYAIFQQRMAYFHMSPVAVFQATYAGNPFVPAIKVAEYVRTHSRDTAQIAVIGSEPEICFYAKRHSATGYLYMYSLVGRQKYSTRMREEFLGELEANRPEYLVYVDVWASWGDREGGPELAAFLSRLREYMAAHYEKVGVADMADSTAYVWNDAATNYLPRSSSVIYVLHRNQE